MSKTGAVGYPLSGGPPPKAFGAPPVKAVSNHMQAHEAQIPARVRALPADYHRLKIATESGDQYNPTICLDAKGDLRVAIRVHRGLPGTRTINFTAIVSKDWTLQRPMAVIVPHKAFGQIEDMRLFMWRGRLWSTAVQYTEVKPDTASIHQALLEMRDDCGEVLDVHIQASPRNEKNWMPHVTEDGALRLVYSTEPLVVLEASDDGRHAEPSLTAVPQVSSYIRGSSQLVPWREGALAIVHQVYKPQPRNNPLLSDFWTPPVPVVYLHRFAKFNADLTHVRLSKHFYFHRQGIEFCSGLVRRGDQFIAGFGVADKESWLAEIEEEVIDDLLGGI